MNLIQRARYILSLKHYGSNPTGNLPMCVDYWEPMHMPHEEQYVLRMLIREPLGDFQIPENLLWVKNFVSMCNEYQETQVRIKHAFCYLTIRHGYVKSVSDDEWHVDGFSMQINHLPEQNYVWCSHTPTQYACRNFHIPSDFDPLRHNIHACFQKIMDKEEKAGTLSDHIGQLMNNHIYVFDPYVVHRRPSLSPTTWRTFVRCSFVPIEISDVNNTPNPALPRICKRDGVREFRDKLIAY